MKIKKLRADFGVLQGAELELHDGLNVITAPNESGKSTWCAFIRAMLYGIDSSERAKAGYKPDKTKYAPWSGVPMRGEMELEHGGREITLTRTTKTANAPMREFSAVYTGTAEPVPGLTGANAGEVLTGAAKAVFERSAFIKQAGVGVTGSPELEGRISSLVSSGAEDECYDDADSRLRAWQRARRYNKRGKIPELEAEISEKGEALRGLKTAAAEREALREQLALAEAELPQIQAEIAEERKQKRRAALERLSENKRLLQEHRAAAESAQAELAQCQKVRDALPFAPGTTPEKAGADAQADADRARALNAASQKVTKPVLVILPLILALVIAALGLAVSYFIFIPAALCLVLAVVMLLRRRRELERCAAQQSERKSILEKYSAQDEDEIANIVLRFEAACAAVAAAENAQQAARERYEQTESAQQGLDSGILSDLDVSSSGRRLTDAQARITALRERLAKADGSLSVMGDPLVIESEKRVLEEKLLELTEQHDALDLAVSVLREANTEIQTRFSPTLGRRAGELFAQLTGGKYESVNISRDFSSEVRENGAAAGHDSLFLSAGAQDQLYLAVRLAICELVLDGEEKTPIILDDALCAFDDERMALALEMLRGLAQERQIILFSCQGREKAFLEPEANTP